MDSGILDFPWQNEMGAGDKMVYYSISLENIGPGIQKDFRRYKRLQEL